MRPTPTLRLATSVLAFLALVPLTTHAAPRTEASRASGTRAARISEDVNIKGIDPKMLAFDVILPSSTSPNTRILYDRATEGDMCFITCNFYNGVTSKWSDYYVSLQPFENFCMSLTGCANQYPSPGDSVSIIVNGSRYRLDMTQRESNSYYLPLDVRRAIAATAAPRLEIEIAGIKMPVYRIGAKNAALIAGLVNTTEEIAVANLNTPFKSKEERLAELESLRKKGLINDAELKEARSKILAE